MYQLNMEINILLFQTNLVFLTEKYNIIRNDQKEEVKCLNKVEPKLIYKGIKDCINGNVTYICDFIY